MTCTVLDYLALIGHSYGYQQIKRFGGLFGRWFGEIAAERGDDGAWIIKNFSYGSQTAYFYLAVFGFALLGYLMGSINTAILISKIRYREDIREKGSGNAGMTNMWRTYGKTAGIMTLLLDMLKAVVPVLAATVICGETAGYIAGFCCILGHAFPIYFKFKGGKGVAVTAAMLLTLDWAVFLLMLGLFVGIVWFSRYISLGSVIGVMAYPIILKAMYPVLNAGMDEPPLVLLFSLLIAAFVVFMHRSNIKRILNHTESKFMFKKKEKTADVSSDPQ